MTYFTQTNNTKMIADAIFEVVSANGEAKIDTVRRVDLEALDDYDIIFVGAPCHDSDLAPPVKGFLEKLPDTPKFKLAGFFTHSTNMPDDTERNQELWSKWAHLCIPTFENACKDKNIEFLGYFNCQGKASEPIEGFIRQQIITDDDEWAVYLPELRKHPNSDDIEDAKKFVLKIIDKL
ncbi:MAG: flavodoxin family protein [Candidatus Thorarchaeota archaeon]